MGTINNTYEIKVKPKKVFKYIEDIWKIQYHLSQIGIKLNLDIISENTFGVGATYHWYGNVLGTSIDSIVLIIKRINNKQIVCQSLSGFEFNVFLYFDAINDVTAIDLTLNYLEPSDWSYNSTNSLFHNMTLKKLIDLMFETIKNSLEFE
ncbi:MAG: hypothetical protein ACFE9N_16775 [Promethearchaeota archaeon]